MKRKLLLILLGILLLIIQGGVLAQDDYLIALNTNGITYLQNGEKCTITLDEQPFPQDFTWHYQFSDFNKLYKHEEYQNKSQRTFVFKAIEPGEVRIIFEIYNPKLGKASTKQRKEFLLLIRNKGEAEFADNKVIIPSDVHNQNLISDRPVSKPVASAYYDATLKTEKPVSKTVVIKPSVPPASATVAENSTPESGEQLTYKRTVTPGKPAVKRSESYTESRVSAPVAIPRPGSSESAEGSTPGKPIKSKTSASEATEEKASGQSATRIKPQVKNTGNPPAPNQRKLTPVNSVTETPSDESIPETQPEEIVTNEETAVIKEKKNRREKSARPEKSKKNKNTELAEKPEIRTKSRKTESDEQEIQTQESKVVKRMVTPKSSLEKPEKPTPASPVRPVSPISAKEDKIDKFSDKNELKTPAKPQKKATKVVSGKEAYSSFHNGAKTFSVNRLNVVNSGEEFCIDFNNNIPADCSWVFDFNTFHFTYNDDQIIRGSSIAPGTPDIHSFRFKANQPGTFTLIFRLFNPNDPSVTQSVSYEIMIR
ncbi:MAG: hypothetical protein K1X92_01735 [Bacteroidia bacterium]|nr:hypothetical protein [Bacteroidia bacterium]